MLGRENNICKGAEARKSRVNLEKHWWLVWPEPRYAGVVARPDSPGLRGLPRCQNLTLAVTEK